MSNMGSESQPGKIHPPTQSAAHFALVSSAAEFLLSMGISRVGFNEVENGLESSKGPDIEWLVTWSISPTSAVYLSQSLQKAIQLYEETFGKIPVDQNVLNKSKTMNKP